MINYPSDKLIHEVSRQDLESQFDIQFTDEQWQVVCSEIVSIYEHYLDADLPRIILDLDSIVEEYK
jgi:hypothetical protein